MKKITLLILFIASFLSYGQEIASFSSVNTECSGVVSSDPNLTANGICKTGVAPPFFGLTYGAYDWPTGGLDTDKYFEWSISPNSGYEVNLSSLQIGFATFFGPQTLEIHIDTGDGSGFNNIFTSNLTDFVLESPTIDLSSYTNLTNTITFRLYGYQASNSFGSLSIYNVGGFFSGKGIIINGSIDAEPCSGATVTTWDGGAWDNGVPTIGDTAVINGNFNTSGGGAQGSFSACSLTVNTGFTLTVADGDFVEIDNNITVDGVMTINPEAVVKQNNDNALVTNNGTITVTKTTAPLMNWYEYTYWSSPVANETVGGALTDADPSRRYVYKGENFLDAFTENNNDNTQTAGQDDIDDNDNDWAWMSGATTMTPGIGYAATHSQASFVGPPGSSPPYQFDYIFNGAFNNGVVTVPIYRNDLELNDTNWNLIGNPYPSAIDADAFLTANPEIDGAIFFWSQNTTPSNNANGNQQSNFDLSDYAIINNLGETAGGDGITPNRYIPSGQAFFVSYSDAAIPESVNGDVKQGTATFNNGMRVNTNNDQFFRIADKSKSNNFEKLWIDLTSDNGIYNQILIGYADAATDAFDGMAYDTPKNLSVNAVATIYSIIDGHSRKFAIQGKNSNSLNEDEIIKLGFKTGIDVATIYELSVPQLAGDFIGNHPIVLKDNLLNTAHNLKESSYSFTSEVGEFNDRFEIVFNSEALSNDEFEVVENDLSIIEHRNGDVVFKLNSSLMMKHIQVIDLQGRVLYDFNVNSNQVTKRLTALSQTPFITKITLDNNQTLIKKSIKRF